MTKSIEFKKGELMTISKGAYSDYCVQGLFRVVKDFDSTKLFNQWREDNSVPDNSVTDKLYKYEGILFMPWLVLYGYLEEIDYRELYLGDNYDYGALETPCLIDTKW